MNAKNVSVRRLERLEQSARSRESLPFAHLSDTELDARIDALSRTLIGEYEAKHGPVEPRDREITEAELSFLSAGAFVASLSEREFVAWCKADLAQSKAGMA